jgi:predicted metal-binding membrane protein
MSISAGRWARATLHAAVAFFVAIPTSCFAFTWMVRNDQDGQAGMGAAFGAFYLGCTVAIVTFVISLRRSSPSRQKEDADY